MNWEERHKKIKYFNRLGGVFHKLHRTRKVVLHTLLALLLTAQPLLAKSDPLEDYLETARALKAKGIKTVDMNQNKKLKRKANKLTLDLREKVKELINKNDFPAALGVLALMLKLGETYGDSALVDSVKVMKDEVSLVQWELYKNNAEKAKKIFLNVKLQELYTDTELKIKGEYWEYTLKKGESTFMHIPSFRIDKKEIPVKVTREEVKKAINEQAHKLNREQRRKLERDIIRALRKAGIFEKK